jgi:hypothetical protein
MMRTSARDFALVYFENKAERADLAGFAPGARYRWEWFIPRTGQWMPAVEVRANNEGLIATPAFPLAESAFINDWAAKLLLAK